MMPPSSKHVLRADESFSKLAQAAGLDPTPYKRVRHWSKDDEGRLHVIARYDCDNAPSLVVKRIFIPKDISRFQNVIKNHMLAIRAVQGHENLSVPKILAEHTETQSYLMQFLPGNTILNACFETVDHTPLIKKAGQWLSAFHAGTLQDEGKFQPDVMGDHLLALRKDIQRGRRKIRGQRRFCELAVRLQNWLAACDGVPSKTSAKHGDLNVHNLIVDHQTVSAFDFSEFSTAPVGFDISRFLLSYMTTLGDLDKIPKGSVVPPEIYDAFFDGYTLISREDPTLPFVLRSQILTDWNRKKSPKNTQAEIRFHRLRAIANKAFA